MKKTFFLLFVFSLIITAQQKNCLVIDEKSGKPMLIGMCDREAFADTNFAWWFDSEYDNYETSKEEVELLSGKLDSVKIKIIMGTWCSDSRREVPRFFKILDELRFDFAKLEMVCVNREKKALDYEIAPLDIKLVPTFIFYRNGKEIGRIIEVPETSLEADLIKILL
jgi:thiol-disulfide isomerase/thioredoxin